MAATTLTVTKLRRSRSGARHMRAAGTLSAIPDAAEWHDFFTGLNYVDWCDFANTAGLTDVNIVPNVKKDDTPAKGWCKIQGALNVAGLFVAEGR